MAITAFYASLVTPIFIILSARVILARRAAQASIGDGGNPSLLRRMRVQANFAEYVPLALILLALAESLRTPVLLLHALGILLVVGRLSHGFGVSQQNENFFFRVTGIVLTFSVLGVAALACLVQALRSFAIP